MTRRSKAALAALAVTVSLRGHFAAGQTAGTGDEDLGRGAAVLMSDLTIPGVTSKFNTQKIIDALMETEKAPLRRMQKQEGIDRQKKSAWQDLNKELSGLRDSARRLYSFQNPFNDKIATSADSKILTATAARDAAEQTRRISVKRLAAADRFLSQSLSRDFSVEAGEYVFRVGDKEVRFAFKGGSLKDFADAVNRRGGDLLAASVVQDSKTSQVLLIESRRTGAKNRLVFSDTSADLALKAGIIERSATASRQVGMDQKSVETWGKKLTPQMYLLQNGALTLEPGTELRIPLRPPAALNPNMVMELSVKSEQLPQAAAVEAKAPPGPTLPDTGGIEFQGIRVQSGKSQVPLPEWRPPEREETVSDMQVLFMEGAGKITPLPELTDSADFQKITIPVGELGTSLESLDIRNRNTFRRISIKDVSVYDRTQRGDYSPKKPLGEASDAVVTVDGIDVQRDSNTIDDLIPGVKLTLKGEGSDGVDLKVGRDVEGIKKELFGFIGTYDRIVTTIDILTRRDERIVEDAAYLTEDEKKKALEKLGLFFGDLTLQQVKDSLQRIMMNPYPTSRGRDLALLAQIGISTDVRKPGTLTSVDRTRLRGYLEVDEPKLDEAIVQNGEAVKELFGNDTNGDLVVDAGIAYTMDTLLRPFVQTGGILLSKVTNLDAEIARTKRSMTDYQRHLDDYQTQLKRKYAQMEGAMNAMEKSSQEIDNFNKRSQ